MMRADRILLIRRAADLLSKLEWSEIDLVLRTYDFPWTDSGNFSDKRAYALSMLECNEEKENDLAELLDHLVAQSGGGRGASTSAESETVWEKDCFRLFLSHDTRDRVEVADLKGFLSEYAVDAFVAHEDIEPTAEWLNTIDLALRTCHAVVAYLTPKFHESKWTDQEIGYCMGCQTLIVPVRFGVDPYGLMMRYQGVQGVGKTPSDIASALFRVLLKRDSTRPALAAALVSQFEQSGSFRAAKANCSLLEAVSSWPLDLLGRLEAAVNDNSQIREAIGVPGRIKALASKHRS